MAMTDISREYGTALFMLACEENAKKEYGEALSLISEVFAGQPEYALMLASPSISLKDRLSAITEAFGGRVPENVLSYVQLMCEKGRINYFAESAEVYKELLDASERRYVANITSATELTAEEKEKLISKLSDRYGGSVVGEYTVDPALIGGVIVEIDGKIMDGSVRSRLQGIKEVMSL